MPSASKKKGAGFEREIAVFLSDLYKESFVRVPNSGAYIGGSNNQRKILLDNHQIRSFKGDIIPPDSWIRFNSECKNYQDFSFHQLFKGSNRQFDSWVQQCLTVADPGDFNILFMKFNHKGTFVSFPAHWQAQFTISNYFYYTGNNSGTWLITDLESFFQNNHQKVRQVCC
jgi:hypothetical protein